MGLRGTVYSRHPLEALWCLDQNNFQSPAGIGVTAVWPRSRPVIRLVVNHQISTPSGAVGSLTIYHEKVLTDC